MVAAFQDVAAQVVACMEHFLLAVRLRVAGEQKALLPTGELCHNGVAV